MNVYAIRHKPTGSWMPARMFRTSGKGWSYWAPADPSSDKPYNKNPRIFYTLQSARNALTAWLQGEWVRGTVREGDWETGYYEVDAEPIPNNPPVERKRDDMEIVIFHLEEFGPV